MFRNYLAAALRNMVRNRLYILVNIVGLTVAFAAALLIALFIRDELSYDTWIPGYENTYLLTSAQTYPDKSVRYGPTSAFEFASLLKADFPAIKDIARMNFAGDSETLRRGDVEGRDMLFWADPNIFSLLPMSPVAGDLSTALERPDSIVLTRKIARKYFGRDDPIGEIIEISRKHPMQVTAVIENLPSNSHLRAEAIASARAPFSRIAAADTKPADANSLFGPALTYLRLASRGAASELQETLVEFVRRHKNDHYAETLSLKLVPLAAIHLTLPTQAVPMGGGLSPGSTPDTIYGFSLVGLLIVGVAVINFINLMTARATRRAVEIGVRKASGAERRDLILQFIGEAFLYVAIAMMLAVFLADATLPALNATLERAIPRLFMRGSSFLLSLFALSCATAVLAGFYPALVLSVFRPVAVLRAGKHDNPGLAQLRQALVILQFAVLIGLVLVAGISYRQTVFAVRERLRIDTDQLLVISVPGPPRGYDGVQPTVCASAFKDGVAALPGVRALTCSSSMAIGYNSGIMTLFKLPDGRDMAITNAAVDFDFFAFYDMKLVAGRVFQRDHGDVDVSQNPDATVIPVVINETAARQYGFTSPDKAVGQVVNAGVIGATAKKIEIIGVVTDVSTDVHHAADPAFYYLAFKRFDMLSARLTGREIPETLDAIDHLWKQYGDPVPPPRRFLNEELEARHRDITQQVRLFTAFAGIAALIGVLGMFGLATAIAERRTKEIGVRKSLGARKADILRLLIWQFTKPVLWANLIAWPVGYFVMRRWLQGFAYHIDLTPWMFLGASALALTIAVATVIGHALLVARAQPVTALRYE